MIKIQQHLLHSSLSVETIHARIESKITNNIGLALSSSQQFMFSGTLTKKGFMLTPIQKGRIVPMPKLYGIFHNAEQGTSIMIEGKPGISTTLNIIAWFLAGLGWVIYSIPYHGVFALGFMLIPLSFIAIMLWFIHREIRLGVAQITDVLSEEPC